MKRPGDFFQKGIDYLSAALLGTVIILVVFFSNVPRYISKSFLLPNGTLVLIAVGGWLLFVGACRFISEKRHLRLPSDEEASLLHCLPSCLEKKSIIQGELII